MCPKELVKLCYQVGSTWSQLDQPNSIITAQRNGRSNWSRTYKRRSSVYVHLALTISRKMHCSQGVIGLVYLHICTPIPSHGGAVWGFKQYFRIQHVIRLNTPITGIKAQVGRFFSTPNQINQSINSQIAMGKYKYIHNGIFLSLFFA